MPTADPPPIDRFPPTTADAGVTVALVHGGFWRARYDRTHLYPLAEALAASGFAVALPEYPRVDMPGGGHPGTADSVVASLNTIVAEGRPVVAVGHSAGGHLALYAASAGRVPGLAGVISLAGVVDLVAADRLALGAGAVRDYLVGRGGAYDGLGPLPPALAPRLRAADPARSLLSVPAVLITGSADVDVPTSVSRAYLARRGPADAPADLVEIAGADHFDLIDPGHADCFTALLDAVRRLG